MSDQSNAVEEVRLVFHDIFASHERSHKSEPLFVSFDVAHGNRQKGMGAIGASILDTRCLTGSTARNLKNHTHSLLWTNTYIFNYGPQGVRRAQKRALFNGGAQKCATSHRICLLKHLFSYDKEEEVESCCQSQKLRPFQSCRLSQSTSRTEDRRPIIIVGHAVHQDLRSLSKAGFDISQIAPILAVLDTQKIARELFWKDNRSKNVSLKEICVLVGFQPMNLHNCGNDAAYTLLVLLSLSSRIIGNEDGIDTQDRLEELIQFVLVSAKTAKQRRKVTNQEEHDLKDWADHLEGIQIV